MKTKIERRRRKEEEDMPTLLIRTECIFLIILLS
jgi:hypothetical protein